MGFWIFMFIVTLLIPAALLLIWYLCPKLKTINIVSRMSKNSYVNLESLEKICLALDCRIEDVIEIHRNEVE